MLILAVPSPTADKERSDVKAASSPNVVVI
jgi:hypothetical protein